MQISHLPHVLIYGPSIFPNPFSSLFIFCFNFDLLLIWVFSYCFRYEKVLPKSLVLLLWSRPQKVVCVHDSIWGKFVAFWALERVKCVLTCPVIIVTGLCKSGVVNVGLPKGWKPTPTSCGNVYNETHPMPYFIKIFRAPLPFTTKWVFVTVSLN